jgi:hypothetical protein
MLRSKTMWAAVTTCVGTAAAIMTNEMTLAEGLNLIVPAILAIFLKHAVSKTQDTAQAAVEAASSISPAPTKKVVKNAS